MIVRYVEPEGYNMWISFAGARRRITKYSLWKGMIAICKCVKSCPQNCGEFVETVES
jgi:hypothetical protein